MLSLEVQILQGTYVHYTIMKIVVLVIACMLKNETFSPGGVHPGTGNITSRNGGSQSDDC